MHALFSYYGSKFKLARRLGRPQRDLVVEPFAGSAGYSCAWNAKRVLLYDIDPTIAGLWRYLIKVKEKEILALPIDINEVSEMRGACQEAKHLVGLWFNFAEARPLQRRSHWGRDEALRRQFWGERIRTRIAHSLKHIRHWKITEGQYWSAPDVEAHWHIDPPYQRAGYGYKHSAIDYSALAEWCRSRQGYVQVCEHPGADWLPFQEFSRTKGNTGKNRRQRFSAEALYEQGLRRAELFEPQQGEHNDCEHRGKGADQGDHRRPQGLPERVRGGADATRERQPPDAARRTGQEHRQARRRRLEQPQPQRPSLAD